MKPGGTGMPRLVISARFAPLPPRSSFWSLFPSLNRYTYVAMLTSRCWFMRTTNAATLSLLSSP